MYPLYTKQIALQEENTPLFFYFENKKPFSGLFSTFVSISKHNFPAAEWVGSVFVKEETGEPMFPSLLEDRFELFIDGDSERLEIGSFFPNTAYVSKRSLLPSDAFFGFFNENTKSIKLFVNRSPRCIIQNITLFGMLSELTNQLPSCMKYI